jgi:hypothetical protein
MSSDVRLDSLPRETIPPHATAGEAALTALAVDDKSFWTGKKEYQLNVTNQHPFTRWYRVVITNLKPVEEYCIFYRVIRADGAVEEDYSRYSQFDALGIDHMIEVGQGEVLQFWLVLGGDSQLEPETTRAFEVVVQEFAVPEERALQGEIWREGLQWIARPDLHQVELHVLNGKVKQPPTILARLLPWRRTPPCQILLDNRSSVPIAATFRIDPSEENKDIGLEQVRSLMREPLPSGKRHREECRILIAHALRKPAQLDVCADVRLATEPTVQSLVKLKAIEVAPIPWMKCWEIYVSTLVAAVLVFWGLFGIPPTRDYSATVTLLLDNLPAGITARDIDVTLAPIAKNSPFAGLQGVPRKRDGNRLIYTFHWNNVFLGWRWGWGTRHDLKLNIAAKPGHHEFAHYTLSDISQAGFASVQNGIELDEREIVYPYTSLNASLVFKRGGMQSPYSYFVVDSNLDRRISGRVIDSSTLKIAIPILLDVRNVHVEVASPARTKPAKLYYSGDFALKPNDVEPIDFTIPEVADPNTGPPHIDPPHIDPPDIHPLQSQAGLNQMDVASWCKTLGAEARASSLVSGSQDKKALTIKLKHKPLDGANYELDVTPNRDCYIQVYELSKDGPRPYFGIDLKTNMSGRPGAPNVVARPVFATTGKNFPVTLMAEGKTATVVVLALETDSEPAIDLLTRLRESTESSLPNWTIGSTTFTVKRAGIK